MDKKKYGASSMGKKSMGKATCKMGTTSMGIPPANQKVRNLEKLSSIATDRKKISGKDKYV